MLFLKKVLLVSVRIYVQNFPITQAHFKLVGFKRWMFRLSKKNPTCFSPVFPRCFCLGFLDEKVRWRSVLTNIPI